MGLLCGPLGPAYVELFGSTYSCFWNLEFDIQQARWYSTCLPRYLGSIWGEELGTYLGRYNQQCRDLH